MDGANVDPADMHDNRWRLVWWRRVVAVGARAAYESNG
jgi:hypothetical protein